MSKFIRINGMYNEICINLDHVVLVDEFSDTVILNTNEKKYKKILVKSESIKKIMSALGV